MAADKSSSSPNSTVSPPLRVGIIDSYVADSHFPVYSSRDFSDGNNKGDPNPPLQHGLQIARVLTSAAMEVEICSAQVFGQQLSCSPSQVANAIQWLIGEGVQLINMSFGLRQDRAKLKQACRAALDAGICLVAASPAQGDTVFPAAYAGVVRATGDARCGVGEISWLDTAEADFGGYPGEPRSGFAGASAGCASVCAALTALAVQQPDLTSGQRVQLLAQAANYHGPERRRQAGQVSQGKSP